MFQHIEVTWRILVYMIALVVQQKDFPHNLNVQNILNFFKLAVENMADTRSYELNLL